MVRHFFIHLILGLGLTLTAALIVAGAIGLLVGFALAPVLLVVVLFYGVPIGVVMAAPVTLLVLPICHDALREQPGGTRNLLLPGALGGLFSPLLVATVAGGPAGAVGGMPFAVLGAVAGAVCGLAYGPLFERADRLASAAARRLAGA